MDADNMMIGSLFDDAQDVNGAGTSGSTTVKTAATTAKANGRSKEPVKPRPEHGLCGLLNQGATCYLNSLIQILFMTPEFRQGLFKISRSELGYADQPGVKKRVIPYQLQRLFGRLMLSDSVAVDTKDLTTCFGWTNNEELHQQDIFELKLELFSALDSSLFGTSAHALIDAIYSGQLVSAVQCSECGHVSRRVDIFTELTMSAVPGIHNLHAGLDVVYRQVEKLDGDNQYSCDECRKKTNAIKSASICRLPPILVVAISRALYQQQSHTKQTQLYGFPLSIDMSPYCEKKEEEEEVSPGQLVHHRNGGRGDAVVENGITTNNGGSESSESGDVEPARGLPPVQNGAVVNGGSEEVEMPNGSVEKNGLPNGIGCSGVDKRAGDGVHEKKGGMEPKMYDLIGVMSHKGSGARSGHYHALIRDIVGLGHWTKPKSDSKYNPKAKPASTPKPDAGKQQQQQQQVASKPEPIKGGAAGAGGGSEDPSSPSVVFSQLLLEQGGNDGLSIDKLTAELCRVTGVSWRTGYRRRYGTVPEFLRKHSDVFEFDPTSNRVKLHSSSPGGSTSDGVVVVNGGTGSKSEDVREVVTNGDVKKNEAPAPVASTSGTSAGNDVKNNYMKEYESSTSQQWFDFNDSTITPINPVDITRQFSGAECAYLLFYRARTIPADDPSSPVAASMPVSTAANGPHVIEVNEPQAVEKGVPTSDEIPLPTRTGFSATEQFDEPQVGQARKPASVEVDKPLVNQTNNHSPVQTHNPVSAAQVVSPEVVSDNEPSSVEADLPVPVDKSSLVPEWLVDEILSENEVLRLARLEYERYSNNIEIHIHFGVSYVFVGGVLRPLDGVLPCLDQVVDRRISASELLPGLRDTLGELVPESHMTVHMAKMIPAGLHLYYRVSSQGSESEVSLQKNGIVEGSHIFIWDGQKVSGVSVPTGYQSEPVLVDLVLEDGSLFFQVVIPKKSTVGELKREITERIGCRVKCLFIVTKSGRCLLCNMGQFLEKAGFHLHSKVAVEFYQSSSPAPAAVVAPVVALRVVHYLDYLVNADSSRCCRELLVDPSSTIGQIKLQAVTGHPYANTIDVGSVRMRMSEDLAFPGSPGVPIHDGVGLPDHDVLLILERGVAPTDNQLIVFVHTVSLGVVEVTMGLDEMVGDVCNRVIDGGCEVFHLCRTNSALEPGDVLDMQKSVGESLRHGERILLRIGRAPLEGLLAISVYCHTASSPPPPDTDSPTSPVDGLVVSGVPLSHLALLAELNVQRHKTLANLKREVADAAGHRLDEHPTVRLTLLTGADDLRPSSVLRPDFKTLDQLQMSTPCRLLVSFEDAVAMGPYHVPLVMVRRVPGQRKYDLAQPYSLAWDVSQGFTPGSLRRALSSALGVDEKIIRAAHYVVDKSEWSKLDLSDPPAIYGGVKKGKKNVKKKVNQKKDLRNSIKDLDLIGVKLSTDPGGDDDDFSTDYDDRRVAERLQAAAETRHQSAAPGPESKPAKPTAAPSASASRKPEVSLKIRVDDFR